MARLLVTLVGLPGTGKSTLTARAAGLLRQRRIPCQVSDDAVFRRVRNKLGWVTREVLRNPWVAARSVQTIWATRQRSTLDLVRMAVNWFCLSFLIRRAGRADAVCLFDEGLFQALWSIGLGARGEVRPSQLPRLDAVPPAPSLTVVVRAGLDTVAQRLAVRPVCGSRLERWLPADPGILPKAGRLFEDVAALISQRCLPDDGRHVLVLHNDGEDALEGNAQKIADKVQQLVMDSPASAGYETSARPLGALSARTTGRRPTASGQRAGSRAPAAPKLYLVLWALFLVLVPFYLLGKTPVPQTLNSLAANKAELSEKVEGGVPQPADYVMASIMLALLAGSGYGVERKHLPALRTFACFIAYVALVNLAWSCLTLNHSILLNTVYYVYGFAVLLVFLTLHARFGKRLLRLTFHGIAVSLLVQAILSPVAPDQSAFRRTLFFNNPNQLGYYAIIGGSAMYLGSRHVQFSGWYKGCVYGAAVYLVILSLSKTALFALAILAVPALLARPLALLVGPPLLAFTLGVALNIPPDIAPGLIRNLQDRINTREVDETFAGRGYDRIANHPEYLFFGAGEGDFQRFRSELISELHSSYGTLLFCYGIVGSSLFTCGLFLLCRRADWPSVVCLVPVFFFGLAHQGLRFNLFWVLLGTLACVDKAPRVTAPARAGARHAGRRLVPATFPVR